MHPKLQVAHALYAALQKRDGPTLMSLLHPDFIGYVTEGLPGRIGGTHKGLRAMLGSWADSAKLFEIVPMPTEFIDTTDDRIVVVGRYEGTSRHTGKPLDAAFIHIWRIRDGKIIELQQVTDSQRWMEALAPTGT